MIILSDLSEVLINGLSGTSIYVYQDYGREVFTKYWQRIRETEDFFENLMRVKLTE